LTRFLRRLEMSLIRKKECLTQVNHGLPEGDRGESILSHSDSAEDSSRYDTSDSSSLSTESSSAFSNSELQDNEKPLLGSTTSSSSAKTSRSGAKKRKKRVTPMNVLENISSRDFLQTHKKRVKKYK
jgi:hypothetical protein